MKLSILSSFHPLKLKLSTRQRIGFLAFFSSFILIELVEIFMFGIEGNLELEFLLKFTVFAVLTILNFNYVKMFIVAFLVYLIYEIYFFYTPFYSPYQVLSYPLHFMGIGVKKIHLIIHILLYMFLISTCFRKSKELQINIIN